MTVKRLVIDVLIPHEPNEIVYAERVSELDGIEGVGLNVLEVDEKTKTVEMTIEGDDLSFEDIKKTINDLGGSVHSIDRVSAGSRIVDFRSKGEGKE